MNAKPILVWGLLGAGCIPFLACRQEKADLKTGLYQPALSEGCIREARSGAVVMRAAYRPLNVRSHRSGIPVNEDRRDDGMQYFLMRLSVEDGSSHDLIRYRTTGLAGQHQRLYYLSFGMQDDIRLVDTGDTLKPLLYHFERTYGLSPWQTVVLGFEKKDPANAGDKKLELDAPFLDGGPLSVTFPERLF